MKKGWKSTPFSIGRNKQSIYASPNHRLIEAAKFIPREILNDPEITKKFDEHIKK